jgi:hypothetical protein
VGVLTLLMGLLGWLFGGRISSLELPACKYPQKSLLGFPYRSSPKAVCSKNQVPGAILSKNHSYHRSVQCLTDRLKIFGADNSSLCFFVYDVLFTYPLSCCGFV